MTFVLLETGELSKLFTISNRAITFATEYKHSIVSGKLCPGGDESQLNLKLDLVSSILGERSYGMPLSIEPPDDSDVFYFDFFGNLEDQVKASQKEGFEVPTMEIVEISPSGLVKVSFSDPFIVPGNMRALELSSTDAQGVEQANVEIRISSFEDDEPTFVPIDFNWKVESFKENYMTFRLVFSDFTRVSSGVEPDLLQVIIR